MVHRLGNKIGEGGCAEVFEWEDGSKIVKLAKPNTITAALEAELHHCRIASACGLPVPKPYDLVTVKGRSGIVFERIDGETIMKRFVDQSVEQSRIQAPLDVGIDFVNARITAQLFHQIHSHAVSNMPSQRENIKHNIVEAKYLSEAEKAAVIAQLDRLPMRQQLCHGDPNPGNILLRDHDAVIIDWNNASTGNPEADLAEYIIMIRYAILPPHLPHEATVVLNATRDYSIGVFMEEYEKLSGIGYADIEPWIAPVAARKLIADAISDAEKTMLVDEIRRRLHTPFS
ncbi:aminoglycoside phosphotransferase family protein [Paenibacillus sp. ClWae2A]|uniref:aminoglycoside phosphotransferase family protein n=1 Tax=Paenibacillus sp. ClWae2A TaxID=3057177 RepID=UPI0028F55EE0|nr:aminoglycoside phosphotransferase family protein [Paenibacillus sp. ClWae2A]MDT9721681.1 aminoglycoside phosphotransferase family protein [Paenibacillus sp. ClWae2A]